MSPSSIQYKDFPVVGHKIHAQLLSSSAESQKPTLVFLHDAIGSIRQWRGFPEEVVAATGCPALVYDRYGYGQSDPRKTIRTPEYLHEEALKALPELLRAAQIKDVLLIGHSDGGSIALIFAGTCPSDIQLRGVITEAAHVFVEEITLEGIRAAGQLAATTDFKEKLSKFHGDKTESVFQGWHDTWLTPEFRSWNIEKYLSSVTCPSLIIQGEDDEYGTPAQVKAIVDQVKGPTQALLLPKCAHVPHYQAKESVLKAMKDFIGGLAP